jgi:hypothetical protein
MNRKSTNISFWNDLFQCFPTGSLQKPVGPQLYLCLSPVSTRDLKVMQAVPDMLPENNSNETTKEKYIKYQKLLPRSAMQALTLLLISDATRLRDSVMTFEMHSTVFCFSSSNMCGVSVYVLPQTIAIWWRQIQGFSEPQVSRNKTTTKELAQNQHCSITCTRRNTV